MSMSGVAQCSKCSRTFFYTQKSTFLIFNGQFVCPNCMPTPTAQSINGLIDLTKSSQNEIKIKMRSNQILKISNDSNSNVINLACNPDGVVKVHTSTENLVQNAFGNGNAIGSFGDGLFQNNFFNCGEIDLTNKDQTEILIKQRVNQVLKVVNNSNQSVTSLMPDGQVTISSNILNISANPNGIPSVFSSTTPTFPSFYFVSPTDPSEYAPGQTVTRNNSTFKASSCTIIGCNNIIEGNQNCLTGNANILVGSNNKIQGHNNEVRGNWNEFVGGRNNKAIGLGNKFTNCQLNKFNRS